MDTNKLTTRTQEALAEAVRRASGAGNAQVEQVHLLLSLLSQPDSAVGPLLAAVGGRRGVVHARAEEMAGRLPSASGDTVSAPQLARPAYAALTAAGNHARELGDEYISTEHLLVGLAESGGPAAHLLREAGATPEALLASFEKVRGSSRVTTPDPENTYQGLEKYGVDLTARARAGELDPVIGRDAEIRRVVQVLSRRTKNNPVLIG